MRIFSNFDTNLKKRTFKRYQEEFWKEHAVLITKGRLFWFINVFLPLSLYFIFIWTFGALFYFLFSEEFFFKIWLPIMWILMLLSFMAILNKYIAYKMDFVVVTPNFLIRYDQNWFFKKDIMTINTFNIRTITVAKQWFLYSIFNTWDLVFLSEWTDSVHWEITLHYIHKPEKKRHEIAHVMGKFQ